MRGREREGDGRERGREGGGEGEKEGGREEGGLEGEGERDGLGFTGLGLTMFRRIITVMKLGVNPSH